MTTHWKIPKPEWVGDTLKCNNSALGFAVHVGDGDYQASMRLITLWADAPTFSAESAARSWVEAQAMKALGAEECE